MINVERNLGMVLRQKMQQQQHTDDGFIQTKH